MAQGLCSSITQVNMRLTTGIVSSPLETNIKIPGLGKNSKRCPRGSKFPLGWFHEELFGISTSLPIGKDADPSNINKKNTIECPPRHQQKLLRCNLQLEILIDTCSFFSDIYLLSGHTASGYTHKRQHADAADIMS